MTTRPPMALIEPLAGFLFGDTEMTQSLENRLKRLESGTLPHSGELPHVAHWPEDDPREQARISADIAARERAGQTCIVVRDGENPLEQLVECFL